MQEVKTEETYQDHIAWRSVLRRSGCWQAMYFHSVGREERLTQCDSIKKKIGRVKTGFIRCDCSQFHPSNNLTLL